MSQVAGTRPGEKVLDYWEPGRMMLSDPGAFLNSLMNYDKENMSEATINKLEPYINNANFQPAKIITVSIITDHLVCYFGSSDNSSNYFLL